MPVLTVKDTDQNARFSPLKPGNYYADIEKAEYKPTKNGGKMIALTLAVSNRKMFPNVTVEHEKKDVMERGRRDAADLLFACNMESLDSWEDIQNIVAKQIMVRIYNKKNAQSGEEESVVGSFARHDGQHRNGTKMELGVSPAKPSGSRNKGEDLDIPFHHMPRRFEHGNDTLSMVTRTL